MIHSAAILASLVDYRIGLFVLGLVIAIDLTLARQYAPLAIIWSFVSLIHNFVPVIGPIDPIGSCALTLPFLIPCIIWVSYGGETKKNGHVREPFIAMITSITVILLCISERQAFWSLCISAFCLLSSYFALISLRVTDTGYYIVVTGWIAFIPFAPFLVFKILWTLQLVTLLLHEDTTTTTTSDEPILPIKRPTTPPVVLSNTQFARNIRTTRPVKYGNNYQKIKTLIPEAFQ